MGVHECNGIITIISMQVSVVGLEVFSNSVQGSAGGYLMFSNSVLLRAVGLGLFSNSVYLSATAFKTICQQCVIECNYI